MNDTRVKISSILESQLPDFIKQEFPVAEEFLSQYYISNEYAGGPLDILHNIDRHVSLDAVTNLTEGTTTTSSVSASDDTIYVDSTYGFPLRHGLIQIDDEIILYDGKESNYFYGCTRGFSGVSSLESNVPDELVFSETVASTHISGSEVKNLSILFLQQFLFKIKSLIAPGFRKRELTDNLNEEIFLSHIKDFYSSKGTEVSFKILFNALYGKKVELIRPRDFLIEPSDAEYRITKDLVVEAITGDPEKLLNSTIFQDENDFIFQASGAVTHVERILRENKELYIISLDSDYNRDINVSSGTVAGTFSIHPKTKNIIDIAAAAETIEVDSTIGFPESGQLRVDLENGATQYITYTSKSTTQFFGCTGIDDIIPTATEVKLHAVGGKEIYVYGFGGVERERIEVRVNGVISDLVVTGDQPEELTPNDRIYIKSLGEDLTSKKANDWIFNIPLVYNISSISDPSGTSFIYTVTTIDEHSFVIGNRVTFIATNGDTFTGGYVSSVVGPKTIQVTQNSLIPNKNLIKSIQNNLLKTYVRQPEKYPDILKYVTNVQNIYCDEINKNELYVTSSSIPSYLDQQLDLEDRSVSFSGTFNGKDLVFPTPHSFYTGDSVIYRPFDEDNAVAPEGIYFVKVISSTSIRLAKSRDNIFNADLTGDDSFYVSFSGTINPGYESTVELTAFSFRNLSRQPIESQRLVRKLTAPESDSVENKTLPGQIGMFINGVELLNYKSRNFVYYGPIEDVVVTAGGDGYDVINPPSLIISDSTGIAATGNLSISGKLVRIDVENPGFDFVEQPIIEISGGGSEINGNARAVANLVDFNHVVNFDAGSTSGVDLTENTIGFSTYHGFRNYEQVIYNPQNQQIISGLTTNASYFVSFPSGHVGKKIRLHKSLSDASTGINTISLGSYGYGVQTFKSTIKKTKIGSVTIEEPGSGYRNRLTRCAPSNIDINGNIINIKAHNYNSGEKISYYPSTTPIGGLVSGSSYYVTVVDEDNIRLSEIGVGNTAKDFYYISKQYVDLTSIGSGNHDFNYEPITLTVRGRIGVSTESGQDFNAKLIPIFSGQVYGVHLTNNGSGYGSADIINHNRQPEFNIVSGENAQITPIISNGRVVDVIIANKGKNYNTNPLLTVVSGSGSGALLTPIIQNGQIVDVIINENGGGYSINDTFIVVTTSGEGAKFQAQITPWTINIVRRLIEKNNITDDDGIIDQGLNAEIGLQYCHAYAPRLLRRTVLSELRISGQLSYVPDLTFEDNGFERTPTSHSPILGWAYDGNPIYGPYGYSDPQTPGDIKRMLSSYTIQANSNRPPQYPSGFFVQDYVYDASGDLDEHNGRFCITPEYPNGTYAYFCTVGSLANSGPFKFYREPQFPYVIGDTYHSKPIAFNFLTTNNQDLYDFSSNRLLRNSTPFNLLSENSIYEFLPPPEIFRSSFGKVEYIGSGSVEAIKVLNGGSNYSVKDELVFDESGSGGNGVDAEVELVYGKTVSQVSLAATTISNIQFIRSTGNVPYRYVGFASEIHNLTNLDEVQIDIDGERTTFDNIRFEENRLFLSSVSTASTTSGPVTYLNVVGKLTYPTVRENDIYQFGPEQVKILNVDPVAQRIRVLRDQNGTSGITSLPVGFALTEKSQKFGVTFGITTSYATKLDREYYFDPSESVGLGTVGINSTLYFSSPGVGVTQLTIPIRSIYIPGHDIRTGDELIYTSNAGEGITVSVDAGISTYTLASDTKVYAAKITNDIIGIATVRVGLGSTGTFVGLGLTPSAGLMYFTGFGTDVYHSFTKNYANPLIGSATKRTVTVSTGETHGLKYGDAINLSVVSGITTTVTIKYNATHNRLVANPVDFVALDVNIVTNEIQIQNHGFVTAQKVIFNSTSSPGGLVDDTIYYLIVVNNNKIKLATSRYDALNNNAVVISSADIGTLSPINPPLTLTRNSVVEFDLSDASLSYVLGLSNLSAFDFDLYIDNQLFNAFVSTQESPVFEVSKSGAIGVDAGAKATLTLNDNVPNTLYYNLSPVNLTENTLTTVPVTIDNEVAGHNAISLVSSVYSGKHIVKDTLGSSFDFQIRNTPEIDTYTSTSSALYYTTNSTTGIGSIAKVKVNSSGKNYKRLPQVSSVNTTYGENAVLIVDGKNIGTLKKVNFSNIGYDYSSDPTLRPTTVLPNILRVNPAYSFKSIGISSAGRNYTIAPNLIVLDTVTGTYLNEVELEYEIGQTTVTIINNTTRLRGEPHIIPVDNINGTSIRTIEFNDLSKDVVVSLASTYSFASQFPFVIGNKILIENTSVGITTVDRFGNVVNTQSGTGYNSANYNYALFTITATDPDLGGLSPTITYNLTEYLSGTETPGVYNALESYGKVIREEEFPVFNWELERGTFSPGESVTANQNDGTVIYWDTVNETVKIASTKNFEVGDSIRSNVTGLEVDVLEAFVYDSNLNIAASSIVTKGWNSNTGFLNNSLQRIHDSDYYQYFSYSLKSEVEIDKWDDAVSNLNHTAGFKKFSDLIVESTTDSGVVSGIQTSQDNGTVSILADLASYVDVNTVYDFDLATENVLYIDNTLKSDQILFKTKIIQDYIEAIGNRVLVIDDISDQFTVATGIENYGVADSFDGVRVKKYIMWVGDRSVNYEIQRQVQLLTLLQYNTQGFLNQYAKVWSFEDLGDFDYRYLDGKNELLFYPFKSEVNDYEMSGLTFSLNDSVSSTGFSGFGCVNAFTSTTTLSAGAGAGTTNTVVGIASTYRAAKFMISIRNSASTEFEYTEVSVIHDDVDVSQIEFNTLSSSGGTYSGLGTYQSNLNAGGLDLWFIPDATTPTDFIFNVETIAISAADTGVGVTFFPGATIETSYTSIASTTVPEKIAQYNNFYQGAYCLVCVHDTTNDEYQISEVMMTDDDTDVQILEFATLQTSGSLGTISAGISTVSELTFVPASGINVDVRVIEFALGESRSVVDENDIVLGSVGSISDANGTFQGTELARKTSFDLYHEGYPLFQKEFNPSIDTILANSSVFLPNHFFTSGEEVVYTYAEGGLPIGIVTATIPGIGSTDQLPETVYIIKNDNSTFQFAASAQDALAFTNLTISNTSGIGTEHYLTSKKQNSRCLITIDNVIQSPVVSTAITSSLEVPANLGAEVITLTGISSFFAGDYAQIGNEIILIRAVGYLGITSDLLVRRSQLGSTAGLHTATSIIRKVYGNYNISNNSIYFATPPYGNVDLTGLRSDEQDYFGYDVRSSFSGRSFLRSGIPGGTEEPYATNVVFDSLNQQFNGISSQFNLQSNRVDVTGISTSNAIVLINSVFQSPQNIDYSLSEVSGITTITFTGDTTATSYDVNSTQLPRGGVIVSVATVEGLGYQPRISAGATATVSGLGTISSLSIGNTGGGYRASSEYELVTTINHPVGLGTTVIYVANTGAVLNKLAYSSSNTISVGSALTDVSIVSVGDTFVTVGSGDVPAIAIESGSTAHINLNNPTAGIVNIGVAQTNIGNYEFIGFTTIVAGRISTDYVITNPGSGYTNTNEPLVIFDAPLHYSNIPLQYSASSPTTGIGTEATIDIVVGQGSSVISFEIKNFGYAYGNEEVLTVPIGGLTGIPTDTSYSFSEFQITVEAIASDEFAGWSIGDLQVLDSIDSLFNNVDVNFPLSINGERTSIRSRTGSDVREDALLLVFLNNVLQVPGDAYTFDGGSTIRFSTAPRFGDNCSIIFYRGTSEIDTIDVEVLDSIKVGDKVILNDGNIIYQEETRLVTDIVSTDAVTTNIYFGAGINPDETYERPLNWTRQTVDLILNGEEVGKDRELYEANIFPTTRIIKDVSIASTEIFVDNVKTFFDHDKEYPAVLQENQHDVLIHEHKYVVAAAGTCTISSGIGSVTNITITNGGVGYDNDQSPEISVGISAGIGTEDRATATVGVTTSGTIASTFITNAGIGYSNSPIESLVVLDSGTGWPNTGLAYTFSNVRLRNKFSDGSNALANVTILNGSLLDVEIVRGGYNYHEDDQLVVKVVNYEGADLILSSALTLEVSGVLAPPIIFEEPSINKELMSVSYEGDFGIISGIGTTSYTGVTTGLVFDFVIPENSFLRDTYVNGVVGVATTGISGIQTGYYFVLHESNIGDTIISLESDDSPLGIGTTFINNIFKAEAVSIAQTEAVGLGLTWVAKVTTKVSNYDDFLSGIAHSTYYGQYSWGRLFNLDRVLKKNIGAYRGENLLTYSEFESGWTNTGGVTLDYTSQLAPFSQTYGAEITTTAADTGLLNSTAVLASGTDYTYSVYIKPDLGTLAIYFGSTTGTTASVSVNFDAVIPTITNKTGTTFNETLVPQSDGWYRASFTFNAGASTAHNFVVYNENSNNCIFAVWGVQVESGVDLTPYSKVTHTAVVRNTTTTDENTYPVLRRYNNLRFKGYE